MSFNPQKKPKVTPTLVTLLAYIFNALLFFLIFYFETVKSKNEQYYIHSILSDV